MMARTIHRAARRAARRYTALPPVIEVLADVMLSHCPSPPGSSRLPAGWRLEDDGMVRRLTDQWQAGERDPLPPDRRGEPVQLIQHAFDYQLQMEAGPMNLNVKRRGSRCPLLYPGLWLICALGRQGARVCGPWPAGSRRHHPRR